jgi:DNA-binding IclR family transcriptional regulator
MACVNPDGTLSASARAILAALEHRATAELVAAETKLPLFRVRSGLRELVEAGLVVKNGEAGYSLTDEGRTRL